MDLLRLSVTLGMRRPFPNEVLHEIVAMFCGEYIDSLIVSVYDSENESSDSDSDSGSETPGASDEDSNTLEVNAIVSLLQVSFRVREMTLSVLSRGMNIPRRDDGRLSTKPWTIIHALRQQILEEHLNLSFFDPPTPFFTCYTLIALIPLLLSQLKAEDGRYHMWCLERMSGMTINAYKLSICVMPKTFAGPVLHRVAHWTWMAKAVMRLLEFKLNVTMRCLLLGVLPEAERDELYNIVYTNLSRLLNWETELKSPPFFTPSESSGRALDYKLVKVAELWTIPSDVEGIKHVVPEEDYIKCKSLATNVMDYWCTMYPQIRQKLESGDEEERRGDEEERRGDEEEEDA